MSPSNRAIGKQKIGILIHRYCNVGTWRSQRRETRRKQIGHLVGLYIGEGKFHVVHD